MCVTNCSSCCFAFDDDNRHVFCDHCQEKSILVCVVSTAIEKAIVCVCVLSIEIKAITIVFSHCQNQNSYQCVSE